MSGKHDYTASGKELQRQHENSPRAEMERAQQFLKARMDQLSKWVKYGLQPEALVRFALLDMQQNEKLRRADPGSIYLGLLACAQTGLEPGALKQEAFLVPFAGRAQFMAGWRGYVKQARRSREVVGLWSNVVRERDTFDLDLGSGAPPVHKPLLTSGDEARGAVIGAYACARMRGDFHEVEWMDVEDLNRIRAVAEARGKSPAYRDWPDQMARKAPIRRLAKRLPLGSDYFVAVGVEQAQEDGRDDDAIAVLDSVTDGAATEAIEAAARGAEMTKQAGGAPEEGGEPHE